MSSKRCPRCDKLLTANVNTCDACGGVIDNDQSPIHQADYDNGSTITDIMPPLHDNKERPGNSVQSEYLDAADDNSPTLIAYQHDTEEQDSPTLIAYRSDTEDDNSPTLIPYNKSDATEQDSPTFIPYKGSARSATVNRSLSVSGRVATTPLSPITWNENDALDDNALLEFDPIPAPKSHATWQKELDPHPRHAPVSPSPRPTPSQPNPVVKPEWEQRMSPMVVFWVSVGLLFILLFSGIFGIAIVFGHGTTTASSNTFTLLASPQNVVVGSTVTLRGSNFTPHGRIGLTRDNSIPIVDTGGSVIIAADANGNFADTIITGEWGNGQHTLYAEDATTHRTASFAINVSGQSALLRPAHLQIAQTSLDMGSGDTTTNSSKVITLTNVGSGQITWQSNASQSWLQVSPAKGTIPSGTDTQVNVVVNRANMQPGSYTTALNIASSAGNIPLPVRMQVAQLQQVNQTAALELSPAVLTFSGNTSRTVTISNPGSLPLYWSAFSNVSWLSLSAASGTVPASSSNSITVTTYTKNLLPGTYTGMITLSGQSSGSVSNGSQTIGVSLIIAPNCSLRLAPGSLGYTSTDQQNAPSSKTFTIASAGGCSSAVNWSAHSDSQWLSISSTSGTTPATPTVSINPAGLAPGTYNGSITISSQSDTEVLPVTFTLKAAKTGGDSNSGSGPIVSGNAALSVSPSRLTINATNSSASRSITISNTGSTSMNWTASLSSGAPGFVSLSSTSGRLKGGSSTTVVVYADTTGITTGHTYKTSVTISATDLTSGQEVQGSPVTIPVTIKTSASSPSMQVSTANLQFSEEQGGGDPGDQSVTISNTGGSSLSWQAEPAATGWLSVTPSNGTIPANSSSRVVFSVHTAGLNVGTYNATIVFKPSAGSSASVTVVFSVTNPPATATPTPPPQPTPTPTATPAPTPTDPPPTATPVPSPTAAPDPSPTAAPTPTPVPTPTPEPVPTPTLAPTPTTQPNPVPVSQPPTPTPQPAPTPKPAPTHKHVPTPTPQPAPSPTPTANSSSGNQTTTPSGSSSGGTSSSHHHKQKQSTPTPIPTPTADSSSSNQAATPSGSSSGGTSSSHHHKQKQST